MKKGGNRIAPQESWRMWILTVLALGFALLVITLLMKENSTLRDQLAQEDARIQAVCNDGDTKNDGLE